MQTGFYAVEGDERALLEFAAACELSAVPQCTSTSAEITPMSPTELRAQQNEFFYLFPSKCAADELIYEHMGSDPSLKMLDFYRSPVIEFSPSVYAEGEAHHGRIFCRVDKDHPRCDEVSRLYRRLQRRIRSWGKTDQFGFRVGPETAERANAGTLVLKHFTIQLGVAAD